MQPLIATMQAVLGGNPGLVVGWTLIGLVSLQVTVTLLSSLRRALHEEKQRRFSRARLELQIKAAQATLRDAEQTKLLWSGWRKFEVARKVCECEDVCSFYLRPHDRKPLPEFQPGQYLTFQLNIPGRDKPVIRCYSLSDSPYHPDYYRVTIKKATPPPDKPDAPAGIASSFFCDQVKEGDILDLKAPSGKFCIDLTKSGPVVLIGGGVGMTPMLSMANAILESGSKREVWFFFGVRNRSEQIQKEHLEKLAAKHENFHLQVCFSRPGPDDQMGRDYQHAGRVTTDLLKSVLPSSNYDFFICGPGPMMNDLTDGLKAWGVPKENIFFESFGPATVKKVAAPVAATAASEPAIEINFSRSAKLCRWRPQDGSVLEVAEQNGITIASGCRTGSCGTCLVAIKSGAVEYLTKTEAVPEEGSCLTCICRPKGNLVLDA
jgi:hypothetical protein